MSTGKNIGATTNQNIANDLLRLAQATTRATVNGARLVKNSAEKVYYNNQSKQIYDDFSALQCKLDHAKSCFSDLTYQLPSMAEVSKGSSLKDIKHWVQTNNTNLTNLEKKLDVEIANAQARHSARIKLADTWGQVHSRYDSFVNSKKNLDQLCAELGKANNFTEIINKPNECATQAELDCFLKQLERINVQLHNQLDKAQDAFILSKHLLAQTGTKVNADSASTVLQKYQQELENSVKDELNNLIEAQKKHYGLANVPSHIVNTVNYVTRYDKQSVTQQKHEIKDLFTKHMTQKQTVACALNMLANPPANETGNAELAKRWRGLASSLVELSHGNSQTNIKDLEGDYELLKALNQRLLNNAYSLTALEKRFAEGGLDMAIDHGGIILASPELDDVVITAKFVKNKKGLVLKTQQVFADDISNKEIAKASNTMCKKMAKAVIGSRGNFDTTKAVDDTTEQKKATLKTAISPSRDDGKVLKRRREYIQQLKQRAIRLR